MTRRVSRASILVLGLALAGAWPPRSAAAIPPHGELLELHRPRIYFEDDGPQRIRVDFPVRVTGDDIDIENNFRAGDSNPPPVVYAQVHETVDRLGRPVWVMEYHFYYRRNWAKVDFWLAEFRNYTHEHDWEWIYIVAGEDEGTLRPYCACFSAHAAANPDLFASEGAVRLFPGVTGGSVWRNDWSRDPDAAPRVSLDPLGRVEATALAAGNAFDGAPDQTRSWISSSDYLLESFESAQSGCGDPDIYFFGDPDLPAGCFFCAGYADCAGPRDPPWIREGLGDRSPLPLDFELPSDWEPNPSSEPHPPPAGSLVVLTPNPAGRRILCSVLAGPGPVELDWIDPGGRSLLRFILGAGESRSISLDRLAAGSYRVRIRGPRSVQEVKHVTIVR